MFETPEFWVLVAFIAFFLLFGKKMAGFVTGALDDHKNKVSHQLEEAKRLHDEALNLLNSYKEKHANALKQASQIISFAEEEALSLKKKSEQEFEKFMAQREKALLERMATEKEEARLALRKHLLDESIGLVENYLGVHEKEKKKLMSSSLKEVEELALNGSHHEGTR